MAKGEKRDLNNIYIAHNSHGEITLLGSLCIFFSFIPIQDILLHAAKVPL